MQTRICNNVIFRLHWKVSNIGNNNNNSNNYNCCHGDCEKHESLAHRFLAYPGTIEKFALLPRAF